MREMIVTTRTPFIGGNWKMHGDLNQLTELTQAIRQQLASCQDVEVAVFPSFIYLPLVHTIIAGGPIGLGGQNLCQYEVGAYTGEISAAMLQESGCRYVIVGHSERRALYSESNDQIVGKFLRAQQYGLCPVLCIGETQAEREAGRTMEVLCHQLDAVLSQVDIAHFDHAVLAYEPVWAIGSGQAATAAEAQAVHQALRQHIAQRDTEVANKLRIIYGGSLKPVTAAEIFAQPDIDGGLVGGASLQAASFVAICQAVRHNMALKQPSG